MRTAPRVEVSVEDRAWLEKVSRSRVETVRLSERALIVLMAADGQTNREIGLSLGITEEKAARWRGRFIDQGRTGIEQDAPGRGRKPTYPLEVVAMVVPDDPPEAGGCDALESPGDGTRDRSESFDHRPHLAPASDSSRT